MLRDALKDTAWFDQWIAFSEHEIRVVTADIEKPSGNPSYRPQYVFDLAFTHLDLLLMRYGRGDPISELRSHLPPLLDAWEEAERLGAAVWTPEIQHSRHAWSVNLDHYIRCFWLTGLALALDLAEPDWQRLVKLMGNEGEDALLDRVIASRQSGRAIGSKLCHPKPYQLLLDAVLAPAEQRASLLRTFVEHWYTGLDRAPKKGLSRMTAMYERPYWHGNHEAAEGAYFGYWCIEAVAAVKAFGIDDSGCLGLPHYPGDLLRPDGPSTHVAVTEQARAQATRIVTPPVSVGDRVRKLLFSLRKPG